jgi:hypothetical protein
MSTYNLDAFDRAGLQLSDEQKRKAIGIVASLNRAGVAGTVEMLISTIARYDRTAVENLSIKAHDILKGGTDEND